jgi:Zn-dependent protease with chaperone function
MSFSIIVIAAPLLAPLALALLLKRIVSGGWPSSKARLALRLTMLTSVLLASMLACTLSPGFSLEELVYAAPAVLLSYAILWAISRRVERRRRGLLEIRIGGFSGRAIIADKIPIAFTVAALGRVYISTRTAYMPPGMLCSIVAHEYGHLRAFSPLPPQLGFPLAVLPAAFAAYFAAARLVSGDVYVGLAAYAGLALLWVVYSWAWELAADLYAAEVCGSRNVAETIRSTSGSGEPCKPSLLRLVEWQFLSLKPIRVAGIGLANPHPPPCLRYALAIAVEGRASLEQAHQEPQSY